MGSLREKAEVMSGFVGQRVTVTVSHAVMPLSRIMGFDDVVGELLEVRNNRFVVETVDGPVEGLVADVAALRDSSNQMVSNWGGRGAIESPSPDVFSWTAIKRNWTNATVRKVIQFVVIAAVFDAAAVAMPSTNPWKSAVIFLAWMYTLMTVVILVLNGPRLWRNR